MVRGKGGKVYLVGAGPGDPGLITLKGKELLEKAEVVVYDRLASPRLLAFASPSAERIYVGKRIGLHAVNQEEINRLIVEKARQGKLVVRLKGGDPYIFGRGGEEAQVLRNAGVTFEVVPGVTSAIAVPAYSGIPLTHRSHTASVAFITGHRKFGDEVDVDWEGLAKGVGTLVFLMGMKNLPDIASRLIACGRRPDTPVAVIRWGTTPHHRSIDGTLETIAERVAEAGFKPPAIIVIGDVVKLRDELNWFERRPLLGKRVLVTRSREQASELVRLLERKGAICIECPTIAVGPPESWEALDQAIDHLSDFQWIIFSSTNAVRFFFDRLEHKGRDIRALAGARLAAVGSSTARALHDLKLRVDLVPEDFRAEGLLQAFAREDMAGKRILIPRAAKAREILPEKLAERGAEVVVVPAYRNFAPEIPADVIAMIEEEPADILTFTSSSTVRNFMKLLPGKLRTAVLKNARVACIGPVTARTAKEKGLTVDILPKESTIPALVSAIADYFTS